MILETRAVEPFMKNGYVVGCEETLEGIVIDPGDDVDLLLDAVKAHRLTIRYILLTHAHLDHVTGVARAKQALGAPVGLHRDDNFLYTAVVQQGIAFGFHVDPQPAVDFFYDGAGPWRFGKYAAWVHHTPGHCPGGVCLAVGAGRCAGPHALRRRHAVCGLDWADRPAGRGSSDAAAIDPRGALQLPGRHRRPVRPRRADDDRPREAEQPVSRRVTDTREVRLKPDTTGISREATE